MEPTNKLRFVEREILYDIWTEYFGIRVCRVKKEVHHGQVLQQWWERPKTDINNEVTGAVGEWRDVPIEVEE